MAHAATRQAVAVRDEATKAAAVEHAGLCGLVARICDHLRLRHDGTTAGRIAAVRAWLDGTPPAGPVAPAGPGARG